MQHASARARKRKSCPLLPAWMLLDMQSADASLGEGPGQWMLSVSLFTCRSGLTWCTELWSKTGAGASLRWTTLSYITRPSRDDTSPFAASLQNGFMNCWLINTWRKALAKEFLETQSHQNQQIVCFRAKGASKICLASHSSGSLEILRAPSVALAIEGPVPW